MPTSLDEVTMAYSISIIETETTGSYDLLNEIGKEIRIKEDIFDSNDLLEGRKEKREEGKEGGREERPEDWDCFLGQIRETTSMHTSFNFVTSFFFKSVSNILSNLIMPRLKCRLRGKFFTHLA